MPSSFYETEALLHRYLLFHYGSDQDLMPFSFGPKDGLHFPVRCVKESLDPLSIPKNSKGLEIGCAVGRSSFELSRYCSEVLAVDKSKMFVDAAKKIQLDGQCRFTIFDEGRREVERIVKLPEDLFPSRVEFKCCDVMLLQPANRYEVVLAANLLCRLPDPKAFLLLLPHWVAPGGVLILASPYSWMEEFTSKAKWLGRDGSCALEQIEEILSGAFGLERSFNLPFLIREHLRKYEWGVAEVSVWRRI